jgi:hypothetical protein
MSMLNMQIFKYRKGNGLNFFHVYIEISNSSPISVSFSCSLLFCLHYMMSQFNRQFFVLSKKKRKKKEKRNKKKIYIRGRKPVLIHFIRKTRRSRAAYVRLLLQFSFLRQVNDTVLFSHNCLNERDL